MPHTAVASPATPHAPAPARTALVRRGLWLNDVSLAYSGVEAAAALAVGLTSGSVARVGFGVDSVIEVGASLAARWRLRADHDAGRRARAERRTARLVGGAFLALAAYVVADSGRALWRHERPERSALGLAILVLSVVGMPLLARAKRRVAVALGSGALAGEAAQTALCGYLSAIALGGVLLRTAFGWWWADPVAALAMAPIMLQEGRNGLRGAACGCDHGHEPGLDAERGRGIRA